MSVLKNKRSNSSLEYYHTARRLRREITKLFLRDFGVKDFKKIKSKNFPDEELKQDIIKQYPKMGMFFNQYTKMAEELRTENVVSQYPEWLVFKFRDDIMNYLKQLMDNITAADAIYPNNKLEFKRKRVYETEAIISCEKLIQCFQYIIEVLPVDVNKLIPYIDMIQKEIDLLKNWRKRTNRLGRELAD